MPEHDISDKLAVKFLPRVTVLIASNNEDIINAIKQQDYGKTAHRINTSNMDVPAFFNTAIEETRADTDIYVFVTDTAYIPNNGAVSRLVEKFLVDDMLYAGIYTDSLRVENGYLAPEFLPAFDPKTILSQMVINNPLAVQQKFVPQNPFKRGVTDLYFYNLIRVIASQSVITHLAEPIYAIIRKPFDAQHDLQIILHE